MRPGRRTPTVPTVQPAAVRPPAVGAPAEPAATTEAEVAVVVVDDVDVGDPDRWADLARSVLEAEGVEGPAELALSFVDATAMAALNRQWMGEDGPTDVLSWSIDEPPGRGPEGSGPGGGARAARRCRRVPGGGPAGGRGRRGGDRPVGAAGGRIEDELALLVVHGVLHVLGFDHADPVDEAAMQARQRDHLTRFHDRRWT